MKSTATTRLLLTACLLAGIAFAPDVAAQDPASNRFLGIHASGNQTQFTRLVSSTLDQPGTLTEVNDYGESPIRGCEVLDDGSAGVIHCIEVDGDFYSIDTETGVRTLVGTAAVGEGEGWEGLAYDTGSETLYGLATECLGTGQTSLYTINPATAEATLVGSDNDLTCGVAIAADADGNLFAYGVQTDRLVSIDPEDGAQTTIGTLDFSVNFSQGMDIDPEDGTCYLFAFNNDSLQAELRTCDLTTAETTLVGPLGDPNATERFTLSTGVIVPEFRLSAEDDATVAGVFELGPVYPNPARAQAVAELALHRSGPVEAVLYDVLGRPVRTVFSGVGVAGHELRLAVRTDDLVPGVYVLRVTSEAGSVTRRLTVL